LLFLRKGNKNAASAPLDVGLSAVVRKGLLRRQPLFIKSLFGIFDYLKILTTWLIVPTGYPVKSAVRHHKTSKPVFKSLTSGLGSVYY